MEYLGENHKAIEVIILTIISIVLPLLHWSYTLLKPFFNKSKEEPEEEENHREEFQNISTVRNVLQDGIVYNMKNFVFEYDPIERAFIFRIVKNGQDRLWIEVDQRFPKQLKQLKQLNSISITPYQKTIDYLLNNEYLYITDCKNEQGEHAKLCNLLSEHMEHSLLIVHQENCFFGIAYNSVVEYDNKTLTTILSKISKLGKSANMLYSYKPQLN